ncbi:unnamed protein product [Colias eurytheme]|nr:unnamed protein product [Colias eurytheme]
MGLSRKTKRAQARAKKLKAESPEAREKRLLEARVRMSQWYSQLSPTSRQELINNKSTRRRTLQARESSVDREQKRRRLAASKSEKRAAESPSSRMTRLQQMREYATNVREHESPSSRAARLEQMREHAGNVREHESPPTRAARLDQMREHAELIREHESPSSRASRLEQMREYAVQSRNNESPGSRLERLSAMRSQSRVRRQLFTNSDATFNEAISQVADVVCYVCHKLLYKKQSRSILTANITVLPQNVSDRIDCCNRCANKLSRNQCPSNAFWNNMTVAPIPPEIECLSEMELRLISRIKPFIKVVRLGGRYGQQGFKGQAILFAQQVEEIPEQLPLNIANAGISVVTENLDNVTNNRRYSVDIEKIKKALEWLLRNNHLYSNVQINTNITNEEIRSSILEAVITLENADHIRNEPKNHFKALGHDRHILRGSFHQGSDRFEEESRGRQCTANAATAIAYSSSKPLNEWAPSDLDRILLAGNTYFNRCMSRLANRPQFLNTEELLPAVSVAATEFELNIQPDVVVGVVNSSAPSDVLEGYFPNLSSGIEYFFTTHDKGIITCQTNIALAVMKVIVERNQSPDVEIPEYYLFDSHSRGPKGYVAPNRGASMLMKFANQGDLCQHLAVALQVRGHRDMQYSITAINATPLVIPNESPVLNEQHDTQIVSDGNLNSSDPVHEEHAFVTTALMPIDTNIPDLNEVVSNANTVEERPIPIYELKRKTVPPVSVLREQRAEELAWIRLFPDGRNGLREQRPVPITPLDYYQTRVMSNDKRFQFNEYIFYALSLVELCKAQQNVSVCGRLRQDGAEPTDVVQNVHLVMRNIRGTSAYWHKAYTDLLAMVKNLGPPHWYLTLSCNDLNWPDMLKALLVADGRPNFSFEDLTFLEKQHLVESYPVTLSRQFMLRLNTLFTRLRREEDPILGKKIIDFWWRIEFQLRGSPHVHMVLWCANMPAFDTPEGIQLLERVVTCEVPDAEDDSEMHDLVVQLQTHRHTQTCFKNNRNVCRFAFPQCCQIQILFSGKHTYKNPGVLELSGDL